MGRIKVVLTEDIENLGRVGEVVAVRGGYGRNFLIPQGKALPASKGNLAMVAERRQVYEAAALKQRNEASELAARMGKLDLTVARKAGEGDTLYGSVTSVDIADLLAEKGVIVDKRRVLITEPIKTLGEYTVPVRLHAEVTAELTLKVQADES
jgi:large subunit ribosomal protein L9